MSVIADGGVALAIPRGADTLCGLSYFGYLTESKLSPRKVAAVEGDSSQQAAVRRGRAAGSLGEKQ